MRRFLLLAGALLGAAAPAYGQVEGDPEQVTTAEVPLDDEREVTVAERWRVPLMIAGSLAILLPPAYYYWNNTSLQREDWELGMDRESWRQKLITMEAVRLDSNKWEANAARHPLAGALHYQVGRANGLGMIGSTVLALGTSVVWEYGVEFREQVSINDMVTNTATGVSVGEPLFQLGLLADQPRANLARRGLALVGSPFDRVQKGAGLSMLDRQRLPWHRLEAQLGGSYAQFSEKTRSEARLGLDLEIVTEREYGRPGTGAIATRPAAWNRIAIDLRLGDDAPEALNLPGIRFSSATSYFGRYHRSIGEEGHGTDTFIGGWTGVDIDARKLANEWDKMTLLHVFGPRFEARRILPRGVLSWELLGAADLGMVQAHVFGNMDLVDPENQNSALVARGYYYSTGVTLASRMRLDFGRFNAGLEASAHQMWQIDGRDRIELNGAPGDPENVTDQRARAAATIGVRPLAGDTRVQLYTNATLRRGAWQEMTRQSTDFDAGAMLVTGF